MYNGVLAITDSIKMIRKRRKGKGDPPAPGNHHWLQFLGFGIFLENGEGPSWKGESTTSKSSSATILGFWNIQIFSVDKISIFWPRNFHYTLGNHLQLHYTHDNEKAIINSCAKFVVEMSTEFPLNLEPAPCLDQTHLLAVNLILIHYEYERWWCSASAPLTLIKLQTL